MMNEWLKSNAWNIIITIVAIIIAFTTLSSRVEAVENKHFGLETRLDKIEELTERLIVIEERTQNNREDILEIKADIKDLKNHFDIP